MTRGVVDRAVERFKLKAAEGGEKAIVYAAADVRYGAAAFRRLLEAKASIFAKGKHESILGLNVLDIAMRKQNFPVVRYILEDETGKFDPSFEFIKQCCTFTPDFFPALLENKPNLDIFDDDGNTPLHWAVRTPLAIKSLLDARCNPNEKNKAGQMVVHYAVARKAPAKTYEYLGKAATDFEGRDAKDRTALMIAQSACRYNTCKSLVLAKASLEAFDKKERTILVKQLTKSVHNSRQLKELVRLKPDLTVQYRMVSTLHLCAVKSSNLDAVKTLVEIGEADINMRNKGNGNAALFGTSPEIVKYLTERKANTEIKNSRGQTPVQYAIQLDDPPLLKALLNSKASPNPSAVHSDPPTPFADIPLADAAMFPPPSGLMLLRHLIKAKADINKKSRSGLDTLNIIAMENDDNTEGCLDKLKLLCDARADPNSKSQAAEACAMSLDGKKIKMLHYLVRKANARFKDLPALIMTLTRRKGGTREKIKWTQDALEDPYNFERRMEEWEVNLENRPDNEMLKYLKSIGKKKVVGEAKKAKTKK